jgi:hypothetical protein
MTRVADVDRRRRSRRMVPWTPEIRALLGRIPDREIADRLGTSLHLVVVERNRHGIRACRAAPPIAWTPAMLDLLGNRPDKVLAQQWDVSTAAIYLKRMELGRPAYGRAALPSAVTWTAEMVRDLGTLSSRAFAKRHGVPVNLMIVERRRRGITGPHPTPRGMPEAHAALLGTMPDRDFAAHFGYDPQYVGTYRVKQGIPSHRQRQLAFAWTAHRLACLGRYPDTHLARRWHITCEAVARKRQELGRPNAKPKAIWTPEMLEALRRRPTRAVMALYRLTEGQVTGKRARLGLPRRPHRNFAPDEDALLGSAPDQQIAVRLGRHHATVAARRRRLGIAAWQAHRA